MHLPGSENVVLSGQHIWHAVDVLRRERLEAGLAIPESLAVVSATVLHHHTPVGHRQLLGGDAQFVQGQVERLALSDWARLLLTADIQAMADAGDRLVAAIRKAGFDRSRKMVCSVSCRLAWAHCM